jgi:hypothetical protein
MSIFSFTYLWIYTSLIHCLLDIAIRKILGTEICIAGRASRASEVKRLPVLSGDQLNFSGSSLTRETFKCTEIYFIF